MEESELEPEAQATALCTNHVQRIVARVRCGAWVVVPLQGAAPRSMAVRALELGCWFRCGMPLTNVHAVYAFLWSLDAGAATGCCCHVYGSACRPNVSALVSLQGVAAECFRAWVLVPL